MRTGPGIPPASAGACRRSRPARRCRCARLRATSPAAIGCKREQRHRQASSCPSPIRRRCRASRRARARSARVAHRGEAAACRTSRAVDRELDAQSLGRRAAVGASAATGCTTRGAAGCEQAPGVGMLRLGEHLGRSAPLSTSLPRSITPTRWVKRRTRLRSWVMKQQRHPHLALQLVEQRQDLRLDRDVERGGRLVGDQQLRPAGERHGDHRALALPARELVRIARRRAAPARGCRSARAARRRAHAPRSAQRLVQRQHLGDLVADRVERIERRHRLLEDHRDARAARCRASRARVLPSRSSPSKRIAPGRRRRRPGAAPTAR